MSFDEPNEATQAANKILKRFGHVEKADGLTATQAIDAVNEAHAHGAAQHAVDAYQAGQST
jgi:hypothetical protein